MRNTRDLYLVIDWQTGFRKNSGCGGKCGSAGKKFYPGLAEQRKFLGGIGETTNHCFKNINYRLERTSGHNNQLDGKICMITGANSGIGKEIAMQLAQLGNHVIMVCRNEERGKNALEEIRTRSGNSKIDLFTSVFT